MELKFFKRKLSTLLRVVLLVAVMIAALSRLPLHAQQQGLNLQISPLPVNLSTPPGTKVTADLRVRNANLESEKLKITLMKFRAGEQDGSIFLENKAPSDEYFNWVSFSESEFEAPFNVWKTVKMTIDVPKEAAFGYYYAVVFSRSDAPKPEPGQQAIVGSVAIFVLLDADSPDAKRQVEVSEFSVPKRIFEFLPSDFNIKVKNTGNVHAIPHGNIFIKKVGNTVATIRVNQTFGNVLPGSSRIFRASWNDGFPHYIDKLDGNGQPTTNKDGTPNRQLQWNWQDLNKLRFGKYTAQLLLIYDDGVRDIPINAEVEFWVLPWRILAVLLVIVLIFVAGIVATIRSIIKRRKNSKQQR